MKKYLTNNYHFYNGKFSDSNYTDFNIVLKSSSKILKNTCKFILGGI